MAEHASMKTITNNSELATLPGNWPFVLCLEMKRIYSWDGTAYIEFPNSVDITTEIADAIEEVEGGVAVWGTVTGVLSAQTDLSSALNAKSPLASPTFTGTVSGVSKSMVGLANADNTSDASKPVSTATQTALDLKSPIASPTFTGTVAGITKAMVGLTNVVNSDTSTTANITDSTNKRFVTDAQQTVIGNTSGTNSGNQSSIVGITGSLAEFNTALTGADFSTGGGTASGTNTGDQNSIAGITGTIAQFNTAVTDADLATTALLTTLLSSYRTLLDSSGSHIAARVAGTYGMGQGEALAITGTGTLYPLKSIYILSTDYPTVNSLAAKLRIRAQLYTNDVSPSGNYTIGLHPITRPGTSGGAGLNIYTIGAAVSGSTLVFTAPAADGLHFAAGADFALPADGHYIIGVVTTATVAASAHVHISASLQIRNA